MGQGGDGEALAPILQPGQGSQGAATGATFLRWSPTWEKDILTDR